MNPFGISTALVLFLCLSTGLPETGPLPKEAVAIQDDEKPPPKVKGVFGKFTVTGLGTVKDKEIVIQNVAFLFDCPNPPANGKTISFQGDFDGKTIHLATWLSNRVVAKRQPFLDFTATGTIVDDVFQAAGVKVPLNGYSAEIQDAADAGKTVRATGTLVTSAESFRYFISKMEVVK